MSCKQHHIVVYSVSVPALSALTQLPDGPLGLRAGEYRYIEEAATDPREKKMTLIPLPTAKIRDQGSLAAVNEKVRHGVRGESGCRGKGG